LKRRLIWAGIGLVLGALLWLPLTSVALCFMLGTLDTTSPWVLPLAAFFYWRDFGTAPIVAHWLPLCAAVAGMVASIPVVGIVSWPEGRWSTH
jgi:hypothetical protein